ncbi:hypothetical protein [Marinilactibacillus psychrotolerans]|uniref:hypothetical protein n=1 Tax=Marinilactibacillus psychrotolerans TaxID=191770 RepID=UPI0026C0CD83
MSEIESETELFTKRLLRYDTLQQSYLSSLFRGEDPHYNPFNLLTRIGYQKKNYENWCVKNVLYLNFLNDYGSFEEVKFDIKIH